VSAPASEPGQGGCRVTMRFAMTLIRRDRGR
jgi:hypothetical protein